MKKIFSLLLIICLTVCSFSLIGCQNNYKEQMETTLTENYKTIISILEEAETSNDVKDYLFHWASEKKIKISYDNHDNVIMSVQETDGYAEAPSTILQCTVDLNQIENTALSMTAATYLLTSSASHGFLRVLFTSAPDGIEAISTNYLTAANFISLDWHTANEMLIGSAGNEHYTMDLDLHWNKPSYTHAYQIAVTGPSDISYTETHHHPNPITIIGDILAQAQSNGILLEIASFNGGTSADTYPGNVSCTVLVNQNDINKLLNRLEDAKDDFEGRYSSDENLYTFSYFATDIPEMVIDYNDAAKLVSFLYTCIDGTYLKDDAGEVIALSNIGKIRTTSGNLAVEICAASKSSDILAEMNSVFDTICGLCGISYTVSAGTPVWENLSEENKKNYSESDTLESGYETAASSLIEALDSELSALTGKKTRKVRVFEKTACSVAATHISSMNVVAFGITENGLATQTQVLTNYLANQK